MLKTVEQSQVCPSPSRQRISALLSTREKLWPQPQNFKSTIITKNNTNIPTNIEIWDKKLFKMTIIWSETFSSGQHNSLTPSDSTLHRRSRGKTCSKFKSSMQIQKDRICSTGIQKPILTIFKEPTWMRSKVTWRDAKSIEKYYEQQTEWNINKVQVINLRTSPRSHISLHNI